MLPVLTGDAGGGGGGGRVGGVRVTTLDEQPTPTALTCTEPLYRSDQTLVFPSFYSNNFSHKKVSFFLS